MTVIDGGAQKITGREDLYRRASLLFDDLGMGGTYFPMFRDQIETNFSETAIEAWEQAAKSSVHAIPLIKRFAAVEGDTRTSGTKGQGRVSSVAFPRMGGVLHKAASKAGVRSESVIGAVELTACSCLRGLAEGRFAQIPRSSGTSGYQRRTEHPMRGLRRSGVSLRFRNSGNDSSNNQEWLSQRENSLSRRCRRSLAHSADL